MKQFFSFLLIFIFTLLFSFSLQASKISKHQNILKKIIFIERIKDKNLQQNSVDSFWNELVSLNLIPYISKNSVIFFYKGDCNSVHFVGDMSSWQLDEKYKAKRLGSSDLWYLEAYFPKNARLDYKIVLNEQEWLLDSNNSQVQHSGFGANSAFSMPKYKRSKYIKDYKNVPKGEILELEIYSEILKHRVHFSVYKPVGYEQIKDISSIYITDGQEYIDSQTGAMAIVLDNLLYRKKIEPILAVFVSPVNPDTNENERHILFINNTDYALFFKNELIPFIDNQFKTSISASDRAILGTSYGGNNACWFAYKIPECFKLIAAQSPSFPTNIDSLLSNSPTLEIDKFYISTGVINDTENYADKLSNILKTNKIEYKYQKVNESHSWGNWSALIDDILLYFYKK